MSQLRIVFMGTAELACASLKALAGAESFHVILVVTQPDRPKGRELKVHFSPVKETALGLELPMLQPARARDEAFVQQLREYQPDLIVVAAYGQILPRSVLDIPRLGCVNVHTSLLPKYRGAAPIQWAILNDEAETGVTIMKMDAGLDTGPMLTQVRTPVRADDNAQTLHDRLAALGAQLLLQTIPDYIAGKITPQPQPAEGVSVARKITKEDGCLHWNEFARALWNRVRALTPWPGTYTYQSAEPSPRLLKIWATEIVPHTSGQPGEVLQADKHDFIVACGQQALRILSLQREGGRRLSAHEFLAGHLVKKGERLGGC
jgi:methionyl-tRNA formyltransferase